MSPQALKSLRLEKLRRKAAGDTGGFGSWLSTVSPEYDWTPPHIRYVREHLDKLTADELRRLMIFLPPRHGKSELVTVRYSAWTLETDPTRRIIVGAYNQGRANTFSRKTRRLLRGRVNFSPDREAVEEWETAAGGGMRAVGVGSGVTGYGGDIIVIDDPVKNREEAESTTYQDKVYEWFTDDLYTRLEPDGAIVLIMTRWHELDLAGRLLEDGSEDWTVISLPAEAEDSDPLGREPGEPLWPDRFDKEALDRIHGVLHNSYFALYQQRPQPAEGGMFKREWFSRRIDAAPADSRRVRYWDKAGTAGGGAFTAGVLMLEKDGLYYVADVVRGQWGAGDREAVIKSTAQEDSALGRVETWVEQEPGSGGKESAEATIKNLAGHIVRADRVTGSKEVRAEPFAAQAEAGNVLLVRGDWNRPFVDELTVFPSGRYRDQVDAASGAFNKLALVGQVTTAPNPFYD